MPPKSKQEFKRQVERGTHRYVEDHSDHEDYDDGDSEHGSHGITGTLGGLKIGGGGLGGIGGLGGLGGLGGAGKSTGLGGLGGLGSGSSGRGAGSGLGGIGPGRSAGSGLGGLSSIPRGGRGGVDSGPPQGGLGSLGGLGNKGGLPGPGPKGPAAKSSTGTGKIPLKGAPADDAYARALGDIVRESSNANREIIAGIKSVNSTNVAALNQVVSAIESITDLTASTFHTIANKLQGAEDVTTKEDPLEALNEIISNIDTGIAKTSGHVYVVIPGEANAGVVSADDLAGLVADKNISVYPGLSELVGDVSRVVAESAGEGADEGKEHDNLSTLD